MQPETFRGVAPEPAPDLPHVVDVVDGHPHDRPAQAFERGRQPVGEERLAGRVGPVDTDPDTVVAAGGHVLGHPVGHVQPQGDPRAYPDRACTSYDAGLRFECRGMEVGVPEDPPGLWYSVVVVTLEAGEAPKFGQADTDGGFPVGVLPGAVRSVSNTIWVQRR